MPDYGDILAFLSRNPPQLDAERHLHASLLELLAHCLRKPDGAEDIRVEAPHQVADQRQLWLHFN